MNPACAYAPEGIAQVQALDFEDFAGLQFDSDDIYTNCLVTSIVRTGDFAEIAAGTSTQYRGPYANGIYTHTLETYIPSLSATMSSALHLATKRRLFIVFTDNGGRHFCFGREAGATLTYTGQTAEGLGYMVSITCVSKYPLFEVLTSALQEGPQPFTVSPDFGDSAYCEQS